MGRSKNYIRFILFTLLFLVFFLTGFIVYAFVVHKSAFSSEFTEFIHILTYIDWFLALLVVTIEIIAHLFNKEATYITFFMALSLLLAFSFSSDAVRIYFPEAPADWLIKLFATLHFAFVCLTVLTVWFFLIREFGMHVTKTENIGVALLLAVCAASYWPLSFPQLEFISFLGLFLFVLFMSIKLVIHLRFRPVISLPAMCVFGIMGLHLGVALTYSASRLGPKDYAADGLAAISTFLSLSLFLTVYVDFIARTTRKSYRAEQSEAKLKSLQSALLKQQISPHFLFNSLQAVKTNYRLDTDKGDRAIDLLSRHLRATVESGEKFMVPFDEELDAAMTFVELANLRTARPFNIIYDIDETDFEVPTLAVETLVENAILYSGVNEREDGYIEISSYAEEGRIIIRISDNGKGFDVDAVRDGAVGIKNAFERFRLLLGAECKIESEPGAGTVITITFRRGEENK